MAQLDITTFYTQSFWLIIVFVVTYLVISFSFLPKLAFIIKFRQFYQDELNQTILTLEKNVSSLESALPLVYQQHSENIIQFIETFDLAFEILSVEFEASTPYNYEYFQSTVYRPFEFDQFIGNLLVNTSNVEDLVV